MNKKDQNLGMNCDITRRDFLNGVNIAIAGSVLSSPLAHAITEIIKSRGTSAQMAPGYYPPTREGLRGSHPGSFEVAHLMRDGKRQVRQHDPLVVTAAVLKLAHQVLNCCDFALVHCRATRKDGDSHYVNLRCCGGRLQSRHPSVTYSVVRSNGYDTS